MAEILSIRRNSLSNQSNNLIKRFFSPLDKCYHNNQSFGKKQHSTNKKMMKVKFDLK